MNKELEKLIDYAITDGFITEKEKKVLIKKAEKQGFDIDELEMILEGKLFDAQQTRKKENPIQKCPSCGEIMIGVSRVCPSCSYVVNAKSKNTATLDEYIHNVEKKLLKLKNTPKQGSGKIMQSVILTYLTLGTYIIFKKVIKREDLFEDNNNYSRLNNEINATLSLMRSNYGEDGTVAEFISRIEAEKAQYIKQRESGSFVSIAAAFLLVGGVLFAITRIPSPEPSIDKKIDRLIAEGKRDSAKILIPQLEKESTREFYLSKIEVINIDSLYKAGAYEEALEKANFLTFKSEREELITKILIAQIGKFIAQKEFKTAKDKAELIPDYSTRFEELDKIKIAEQLKK